MRLYGMCALQLVLKCHTGFISPSAEFPSIAEVETSPQQTQLQAMSKHQTSVIRAEHSGIRWIRTSNPRSAPCVAPTIFPIGPVYHTCDMPTTAPAIPEKAAKSPAIPIGNLHGGGGSVGDTTKWDTSAYRCTQSQSTYLEGLSQSARLYPPKRPFLRRNRKCSSATMTMKNAVQ